MVFSMHVSHSVNGMHRKSAGTVQLFHCMLPPPPQDQLLLPREHHFVSRQLPCPTMFCMNSFAVMDKQKTSVAVRLRLIWTHSNAAANQWSQRTVQGNVISSKTVMLPGFHNRGPKGPPEWKKKGQGPPKWRKGAPTSPPPWKRQLFNLAELIQ